MHRQIDGPGSVYFGSNAGKAILQEMEDAQTSILVISPYLSSNYIHFLAKRASAGIKVTAITQTKASKDMGSIYREAVQQDINIDEKSFRRRKIGSLVAKFSIFTSLFLPYILTQANIEVSQALAVSGCLFLFGALLLVIAKKIRPISYSYSELFDFFILPAWNEGDYNSHTPFVHAKIYIIDGQTAFIGSPNLTWSGLRKNCEVVVKVKDEKLCKSLYYEARDLARSASRLRADLTGPQIYQESW
jgi:phosphatidylserine/phosphatidylglycerophosphate/cardiolipin synthase-like enzyme